MTKEGENIRKRSVSVQDVKEKLRVANAKIVTLLRDKIALSDQIGRMG